MTTLFVSDLHLDESRPGITALFLRFLENEAAHANALYILGDLFEAWVGDDEASPLADAVRSALLRLSSIGVPSYFLRGNRDFLIGPRFAADTGTRLLADPCVALLNGEPTLLMHGDLLCTQDHAYQAFRQQVRDPAWRGEFLAKPLTERHAFAAQARIASRQHQSGLMADATQESICDVTPSAVQATMAQYGVARLIHGHTHRPGIHSLRVGDQPAQRIVLGDWYEQGSVLRVSSDGLELSAL